MGANYGNHIVRMYGDYNQMRNLASLIIVINPNKLGTPLFASTMAGMVSELRDVSPVPGVEKVLAPNDLQIVYKQRCFKEGIPVASGVYEFLNSEDSF